jgi:serine protease Do
LPRPRTWAGPALLTFLCTPALRAQQAEPAPDDRLAAILAGEAPQNLAELRAMQDHLQDLVETVLPATVSLGNASGVIVEGGFVLTAGHVTGQAGRKIRITLHDGRAIEGESLGLDMRTDTGLIRILGEGEFPARPLGRSGTLRTGQWCLMLGHPSGAKPGRSAPARLGRVLRVPEQGYLVTDCTMQGGDSGGPLFDMDGRVIGINSRISGSLAQNMHVPIDAFHAAWDRLVAGEVVQISERARNQPLGLRFERGEGVRIREVVPGSRALEAGFEVGDEILKVDGKRVADLGDYARVLRERSGEEVAFEVARGEEVLVLKVDMPRRQS